jgi:hypothetical protein
VQAPVLVGIRVRLVPRVDDRSLQRGLQTHLGLEEVRALRELVDRAVALVPLGLGAELAGAGEDLPRDEERRQVAHDVAERQRAVDQVVLVRAVGVALAVGVVLVDLQGGPGDRRRASSSSERSRTRSPALSCTTRSRGVMHSGVEYSGCAWST